MTRPRKIAKRPSNRQQIAGPSSKAPISNRSSPWIDTDDEMEDADVQEEGFQDNDTEQDAAEDDDSELTVLNDQDDALLSIQTNWGIKRLEEVIKEGTWLKGMSKIDKIKGTNDIKFENATILAARDLAEVSNQKKAHVQAEMADMWKDRDKARVPGEKVGASWQDKQKNMRVDFGRLRAKMAANPQLGNGMVNKNAAAPKTKGNKTLPEPSDIDNPKRPNAAPQDEQLQDNADRNRTHLMNNNNIINQPNNSPHPAQNESSSASPPSHPSSPVQQRREPRLTPPPKTQAPPPKPTQVDQIEWDQYKAAQATKNAEIALEKKQVAKKALANKRGATAYEYAKYDRHVAVAAAKVEKTLLAQEHLAQKKLRAEFEEEDHGAF